MKRTMCILFMPFFVLALFVPAFSVGAASVGPDSVAFPRALDSYGDAEGKDIYVILKNRVRQEPFNLIAAIIFFCAVIHTFMVGRFLAIARKWEARHLEEICKGNRSRFSVHRGAKLFHFLGDVEVIFGLWSVALIAAIVIFYDRSTMINYLVNDVNFTEPLFVVVVMILAASRPILKLAESMMQSVASMFGGSLTAWWLTILTLGPILGSLVTEPAAMTISALLLGAKVYDLNPSEKFKYATLGLLFVNVSVGGTLTHFAAPPVLMVSGPWDWGLVHMLSNFGWKAILGILLSNGIYYIVFHRDLQALEAEHAVRNLKDTIQRTFMRRTDMLVEFERIDPLVNRDMRVKEEFEHQTEEVMAEIKNRLEKRYLPEIIENGADPGLAKEAFDQRFAEVQLLKMQELMPGSLPPEKRAPFFDPGWDNRDDKVPVLVTGIHVIFMAWIVSHAHHPELFIPGLLFFLGFTKVTIQYQNRIDLIPPMMVGFFLGGLVVHGGVQGWWIAPLLGNLKEIPLMVGASILTSFNDNAAITFLSTLVPGLTEELKYAVLSGAVAGGGLTVIANAPNPAGQSILKKYFNNGVSAVALLKASLLPTCIVWLCFFVFR